MLKKCAHTAISVRNMETMIGFYRDELGLELHREIEVAGEGISKGVGLNGVRAKVAFLTLGEFTLELFEYENPRGREVERGRPCDFAITHIAFDVDDIDCHYQELKASGVSSVSDPVEVAPGVKIVYLYDPEGNIVELIERSEKG